MTWKVVCADALDALREMPDASVDAVVTDPPGAINFMSKNWDHDKGGREQWIAWLSGILREACRVMKPGAHAVIWALPRTSGWTHRAIEDSGLDVRDCLTSLTGQGFPKSLNVTKQMTSTALACNCPTHDLYYPNGDKDLTSENVRGVRLGLAADDAIPSGEKQDLFAVVQRSSHQFAENWSKVEAGPGLPVVPPAVSSQEQDCPQQSEALFSGVCGEAPIGVAGVSGTYASHGREHEGQEAQRPALRVGQPVVEGRSHLFPQARELQADQVRALSAGVPANGTEGRVRDGAPRADGTDGGLLLDANGSSASPRSRSTEQQSRQPGIVAGQPEPQNGGGWEHCDRCGLPIAPAGLGSALKPSVEFWYLARKPLAASGIAQNVARYGTGGLNVDATRVRSTVLPTDARSTPGTGLAGTHVYSGGWSGEYDGADQPHADSVRHHAQGRFPPNLLLSHTESCVPRGTKRVKTDNGGRGIAKPENIGYGEWNGHHQVVPYADADGTEECESWECARDPESGRYLCPIALLDEQGQAAGSHGAGHARHKLVTTNYNATSYNMSGEVDMMRYGDSGSNVSRFFPNFSPDALPADADGLVPFRYVAKSSRRERGCGLPEGMTNTNPCVKPVALLRWLTRLVCVRGGTLLDPFMGSGSGGIAALLECVNYIGIEQNPTDVETARHRIAHVERHGEDWLKAAGKAKLRERDGGTYGGGKGIVYKVPRCPEHDVSFRSGTGLYICGCPFVHRPATENPRFAESAADLERTPEDVAHAESYDDLPLFALASDD